MSGKLLDADSLLGIKRHIRNEEARLDSTLSSSKWKSSSAKTYFRIAELNGTVYMFADRAYTKSEDEGLTWSSWVTFLDAAAESMPSGYSCNNFGNAYPFVYQGTIYVAYRCHDTTHGYYSIRIKPLSAGTASGTVLVANIAPASKVDSAVKGLWEPTITSHTNGDVYINIGEESTSYELNAQRIISYRLVLPNMTLGTKFSYPHPITGRRFGCLDSAKLPNVGNFFIHVLEDGYGGSGENCFNIRYYWNKVGAPGGGASTASKILAAGNAETGLGYIAPQVSFLNDGRMVLTVHTNKDYSGIESNTYTRNYRYKVFVSKAPIAYGSTITLDDFIELPTVAYEESEYSRYGTAKVVDGILYRAYGLGKNVSATATDQVGSFIMSTPIFDANSEETGNQKEFIRLSNKGIKVLDNANVTAVFTSPSSSKTSGGVKLYKRQFWGTKKGNELSKVTNNVHDCGMAEFLAGIFGMYPSDVSTLTAENVFRNYGPLKDLFPKEYTDVAPKATDEEFMDAKFKQRKFYTFYTHNFLYEEDYIDNLSIKTHDYLANRLIVRPYESGFDEANARFMVKFVKDYEIKETSKGKRYWTGQMSDYWLEVQIRITHINALYNDNPVMYFVNVYPRKF